MFERLELGFFRSPHNYLLHRSNIFTMYSKSVKIALLLSFLVVVNACAPRVNIIIANANAPELQTIIHYKAVKHKKNRYPANVEFTWGTPKDAKYNIAVYGIKDGKMDKGKRVFSKKNVTGGSLEYKDKIPAAGEFFFVFTPANKAASAATPNGMVQRVSMPSLDGVISIDIGGKYCDKTRGECVKGSPYSIISAEILKQLDIIETTNPTPKSITVYIDRAAKIQSPSYASLKEARRFIPEWLASLPYCLKEKGDITYSVLEQD